MRIALINTLYPPSKVGGAERSVAVLAEGLADAGHDVHAIALADIARTSVERIGGVTVHRLPHGNRHWPFDNRRRNRWERLSWHWHDRGRTGLDEKVRGLLEAMEPDVVHTNNLTGFGSGIVPVARELGLPVVHTLRDFSLLCARASLFRKMADCEARCASCRVITGPRMRAAGGIGLVVGNSRYMIDRHREEGLFRDVPARTIFNAVPGIADGGSAMPDFLDDREVAGGGTCPQRLGFAGAIKPEKGIERLLDACAMLPETGWTLTIAGEGEPGYVDTLKDRSAHLPVAWLGFVPIERFFAESDTVVIPSIWPEPMPRILIEAMAHGRPAIVSDAGGSHEVAALYPAAKVYPRGDTAALSALMAQTIANGPQRHPPDAALIVRFGVDRLVAEYCEAYSAVIPAKDEDV